MISFKRKTLYSLPSFPQSLQVLVSRVEIGDYLPPPPPTARGGSLNSPSVPKGVKALRSVILTTNLE